MTHFIYITIHTALIFFQSKKSIKSLLSSMTTSILYPSISTGMGTVTMLLLSIILASTPTALNSCFYSHLRKMTM